MKVQGELPMVPSAQYAPAPQVKCCAATMSTVLPSEIGGAMRRIGLLGFLLVAASARGLFDRDMPPGAEPEELMAMKVPALIIPGDDPAHATSGAHYLRELLPQPEFWPRPDSAGS